MGSRAVAAAIAGLVSAGPAAAYGGWHIERATVIPRPGSAWDHLAMDQASGHPMVGHRERGPQVFDPEVRAVVKTVAVTAEGSPNGAVVTPEFDLGVSNGESGSLIPFEPSTLEAMAPVKGGQNLDAGHCDRGGRRLVVNMEPGKDGTDLVPLDVPSLRQAGRIKVDRSKVEGADSDGASGFFLAARDLDEVHRVDVGAGRVTAAYDVAASCGQPTAVAVDAAGRRVITAEIGGGVDAVAHDADRRRIFTANGVSANLGVFEQGGPDGYKPVETLGTRAGLRTTAMDRGTGLLYGAAAEGAADASKKIPTAVSAFYANAFFPDTLTVLTDGR